MSNVKQNSPVIFDTAFRNNSYHLYDLKEYLPNLVPFLGAGASKSYGFPLWYDFISKIIDIIENGQVRSESNQDISEKINHAKNLLKEKKLIEAIDYLENIVGRLNTYVEHLMLRILNNEAKRAKLTFMVENKNTGLWGKYLNMFPSKKYLTTNYDIVIETVLRANIRLFNESKKVNILTPFDINRMPRGQKQAENDFVVYHLHGVYTKPETIIFSSANYDDSYGTMSSTLKLTRQFPKLLDDLNRKYSFLFIGCSLNTLQDRIYDTLNIINRSSSIEQFHYAFLNSKEITDLNKKEDELMQLNIKALWYSTETGDDNEHQQAIKELCSKLFDKVEDDSKNIVEIVPEQFQNVKQIEIPLKYSRGNNNYIFYLIVSEEIYYITDKGVTYEKLDEIFELREPDVKKNLHTIIRQYENDGLILGKYGQEEKQRWIMIKLKNNKTGEEFEQELEMAIHKLITCISFMDNMRIFYT